MQIESKNGTIVKNKKTCFFVTPIGKPDSNIRRQIDGIIELAIKPAFGNEYFIEAAHTYFDATSITKQVYQKLYDSDLVIANLTNLNPNVMYELGIRFCFGKPTILIAEKETQLPFDINEQRTFFYTDDALGMVELKEALEKIKETIVSSKIESPIHDALKEVQLFKQLNSEDNSDDCKTKEMLSILIKKMDKFIDGNSVKDEYYSSPVIDYHNTSYDNLINRYHNVLIALAEMETGELQAWKLKICRDNLVQCFSTLDRICDTIDRERYYSMKTNFEHAQERLERLEKRL